MNIYGRIRFWSQLGFPVPLPSAPNPDKKQLSRLGERRNGRDGTKAKTDFTHWCVPGLQVGSRDGGIDATLQRDLEQFESMGFMHFFP